MAMDAIQVPTRNADSKVKEKVQNGKSWRTDWNIYQALILVESRFFSSLKYQLGLSKENTVLLPECCKITLFVVQFSKNLRGGGGWSMPSDSLEKLPPGMKKILHFEGIPLKELKNEVNILREGLI